MKKLKMSRELQWGLDRAVLALDELPDWAIDQENLQFVRKEAKRIRRKYGI